MARARIELPPSLLPELRRRLAAEEPLDTLHAWLQGQGWPGSRSVLAERLATLRARPEEQLRDQVAQGPAPSPLPAAPEADKEEAGDALADLREARALVKALAKRAAGDVVKGGGSLALALKATREYTDLVLRIRKLEREERPKEKGYRIVEARLPAKTEIQ